MFIYEEILVCLWHVLKILDSYSTNMLLSNNLVFQVPDENATYILEPVTNEEYYQDDQNIMWIQETVEVEQVRMQHKLDRAKLSILMFKIPNLISRPHSRRVTTRCRTL